jgi:hypothetical protein
MERYCNSVPACYLGPLKTALRRLNVAPRCVPSPLEGGLSFAVAAYLKRVKQQARTELERCLAEEVDALMRAAAATLPPKSHTLTGAGSSGYGGGSGLDSPLDSPGSSCASSPSHSGAATPTALSPTQSLMEGMIERL